MIAKSLDRISQVSLKNIVILIFSFMIEIPGKCYFWIFFDWLNRPYQEWERKPFHSLITLNHNLVYVINDRNVFHNHVSVMSKENIKFKCVRRIQIFIFYLLFYKGHTGSKNAIFYITSVNAWGFFFIVAIRTQLFIHDEIHDGVLLK